MNAINYLAEAKNWLNGNGWILQLFLIVLATAIINFIEVRFYQRVYPRLQRTRTIWDDTLLYAVQRPISWLIWVLGLSFALDIVEAHAKGTLLTGNIDTGRNLAIVILIVWALLRFIGRLEHRWQERTKHKEEPLDRTTVHAICQILRTAVVVTAILISLQNFFGLTLSSVWAMGGIGGIALGFAAKDMLSNYFGGLMIYLSRPFSVGDWIRSPDKAIEGTVEYIGWRLTRIITFDKRPLYIPNGLFSTIVVENPSRMSNRRIYTNIGIRYDDANKMADLLKAIEEMLRAHPDIDQEQTLMVNLVEFGASSLNFMIYTFTKTVNWVEFQAVQQDVFLKVLKIIGDQGAQCAFPTTTVHIPGGITPVKAS